MDDATSVEAEASVEATAEVAIAPAPAADEKPARKRAKNEAPAYGDAEPNDAEERLARLLAQGVTLASLRLVTNAKGRLTKVEVI